MLQRSEQLAALRDGEGVTVIGRYVRWAPGPSPPGAPVPTVRIELEGGEGVLLGQYATPECERADDELARLEGCLVRTTGTYLATRPWTGTGPPPGTWTGGGPQLVEVGPVELA